MPDLTEDLETLKKWRENNERKSREIIDIWMRTVERNIEKSGKEKPLVLEQVCYAALDCHCFDIAQNCIGQLHKEFPTSLRVKKFQAMLAEANEEYETALKILNSIIGCDETNSSARKRRVSILKAQGRISDAIKELAEYLKIFMADVEAWQELSELYLTEQDYNKAAFCVEELILHNPHNHLLHQRYADIRYTQGNLENLELAKAYYSQAVYLNEKNLRALYGLLLTTTAIATSQKSSAQKKKEVMKTAEWAAKKIRNHYSDVNTSHVENCLSALTVN